MTDIIDDMIKSENDHTIKVMKFVQSFDMHVVKVQSPPRGATPIGKLLKEPDHTKLIWAEEIPDDTRNMFKLTNAEGVLCDMSKPVGLNDGVALMIMEIMRMHYLSASIYIVLENDVTINLYVIKDSYHKLLIGISGRIGTGKSTVAKYLIDKFGFVEYMMADPLKKIGEILEFDDEQLYGSQEKKLETNKFWGVSARKFLQVFGTEICRDILPAVLPDMNFNGTTIWCRLFEMYYQKHIDQNTVISDIRFPDEEALIKNNGGYIIKLVDPNTAQVSSNESVAKKINIESNDDEIIIRINKKYSTNTHMSEMLIDQISGDYTIINDKKDIDLLYAEIELVVQNIIDIKKSD